MPEWSERDGVVIIEAQESPPSDGYLDRTVAAQLLAKHLNQIRGLSLPFGEPESPVFVISLEAGTEVLEPLSPVIGNTVRLEAIAVPGVPGTARIEVLDGRSAEMREVATAIRDVIGRRGEAAA